MIRLRRKGRVYHARLNGSDSRRSTGHTDLAMARLWVREVTLFGRPRESEAWIHAARRLVRSARSNASVASREHSLHTYDVLDMLAAQNYRCAVSGALLEPVLGSRGRPHPWAPSIDRINNAAGYTEGNVRLVCTVANLAMNAFGEDVLYEMARCTVNRLDRQGESWHLDSRKLVSIGLHDNQVPTQ